MITNDTDSIVITLHYCGTTGVTLAVTEMFDQPAGIIEHLCVFKFFSCSTKKCFGGCCLQLCNCAKMFDNCAKMFGNCVVSLKIND